MSSFPFQPEGAALGKAIGALGAVFPTLFPGKKFPFGMPKEDEKESSGSASPWSAPGGSGTSGAGQKFTWTFPQYSQTWAFTPPAPSAFNLPPQFDPKSKTGYYTPPKPSTTASKKLALADIMAKYK